MQHELGQFNVELNLAPRRLRGRVLRECESDLAGVFDRCRAAIEALGVRLVAVGMLPTLSAEHLTVEHISHSPRYELLARRVRAARHRPFSVRIVDGCEPVEFSTDSVAPDAATTSLQLHLRVPPDRFATYYNAAQTIAGAQLAVARTRPTCSVTRSGRRPEFRCWRSFLTPAAPRSSEEVLRREFASATGGSTIPVELFDEIVRDFLRCFPRWKPRIPTSPSMRGVFRARASSGCTTARCGVGTVPSTTSRPDARSCASKTGCCPADRPPST